jgi:hypothetical protein
LAVLLQLRDQLITLLDNVLILLALVVRPVGFDDSLAADAVDRARNTATGNELGQVSVRKGTISDSLFSEGERERCICVYVVKDVPV